MLKKISVIISSGIIISCFVLLYIKKSTGTGEVMQKTITLESSAFTNNTTIPEKYTGESLDVSPPLSWQNIPTETQSLVLISDDPDAPEETWVHWVVYDLPATINKLSENADIKSLGGTVGKNSFDSPKDMTYGGPMPPKGHGPHRYYFKIYALNKKLNLPAGATKQEVEAAMQGNIIATGQLIGIFERK